MERSETLQIISKMAHLKFFPATQIGLNCIAELLEEICHDRNEAVRLVREIVYTQDEWPGPATVRTIHHRLFPPPGSPDAQYVPLAQRGSADIGAVLNGPMWSPAERAENERIMADARAKHERQAAEWRKQRLARARREQILNMQTNPEREIADVDFEGPKE